MTDARRGYLDPRLCLHPDEPPLWEERAAIREYGAGMERSAAERAAFEDVRRMRKDRKEAVRWRFAS